VHLLERTICIGLSYLLNIVLAIYDKEVFAGFSSPRGFPRINVVSLVNVYFSVILFLCCSYLLKCKVLCIFRHLGEKNRGSCKISWVC
jgi:hypothetical protein